MTAEQFLADLEAKAKAATLEEWREGTVILSDGSIASAVVTVDGDEICNTGQSLLHDVFNAAYIAAANPAAVLRLVGMVRFLAFSAARSRGVFMDPAYWLDTAYIATENHHD